MCECVLHCFPHAQHCCARFLPPRCPQHLAVSEGPDGCAVEDAKAAKECSKLLDFAAWLEAFDQYTLAAVITKQMSFLEVCSAVLSVRSQHPPWHFLCAGPAAQGHDLLVA